MHSSLSQFAFLDITESRQFMTVLAYCDESGKFSDQSVVSFGAAVGYFSQVVRFESEWKYCLREAGLVDDRQRVTYLTMKDALNLNRPFSAKNRADDEKSRVVALLPFIDCLRKNMDRLMGAAIDVNAFHSISQEAQKQLGRNPQYAAFTRIVLEMLIGIKEGEELSVVCDDEEEVAPEIYKLYRKVKRYYPKANKQLASLSLADDKVFCPVQGADLLASLIRMEARRVFLCEDHWSGFLYEYLMAPLNVRPQSAVTIGLFDQAGLVGLSNYFVEFEQKYGRYGVPPLVEK